MFFVERGEIMGFFSSAKNIVFLAVIFILLVVLVVTTVVLAHRGSAYNAAYMAVSAELESTQSSLVSAENENDSYAAQLETERNEKKRLEEENAGLKSQIEQLKAKKAAEEAKRLALLRQQQQQQQKQQQSTPPPATKACYLTFDDGPCENTLAILDILARYNVKATFFIKGAANVAYLKNIQAGGHAIGLHTYSHVYSEVYASDEAYFNDLNRVSAVVQQHTGIKSMLVRFPGGSSNTTSKNCIGLMTRLSQSVPAAGYTYFDWNVDSGDAAGNNAAQIQSAVLTQASRRSGAICVLMHDVKINTTAALPGIIEGLRQQGFYFDALTPESYGFHHPIAN